MEVFQGVWEGEIRGRRRIGGEQPGAREYVQRLEGAQTLEALSFPSSSRFSVLVDWIGVEAQLSAEFDSQLL